MYPLVVLVGIVVGDLIPGLTGPGCAVVGESVYAFGGALSNTFPNHKVYKMDSGSLEWDPISFKMPYDSLYPEVAVKENSTHVLLMGGMFVSAKRSFYDVNIDNPNATRMLAGLDSVPAIAESGFSLIAHGGGFVLSDLDLDSAYKYIGDEYTDSNGDQVNVSSIYQYSFFENKWSYFNQTFPDGPRVGYGSVVMHNGDVYVFGGRDIKTRNPMSLKTIWKYDTLANSWSNFTCSGEDPGSRFQHAYTKNNNLVYVIGGQADISTDNRIDILDLDTFTWSKKSIDGIKGKSSACLVYRKRSLIYDFGADNTIVSNPMSIDTQTWKLVQATPGLPAWAIVLATIGAFFGALLIVTLSAIAYRHRRAYNERKFHHLDQPQVTTYKLPTSDTFTNL